MWNGYQLALDLRVEIIDWKTDAVESPADLTERYTAQMNAYGIAMRALYPDAVVECQLVSVPHRCKTAWAG